MDKISSLLTLPQGQKSKQDLKNGLKELNMIKSKSFLPYTLQKRGKIRKITDTPVLKTCAYFLHIASTNVAECTHCRFKVLNVAVGHF